MGDPLNVYCGRGRVVFIDRKKFPPTASPWANPYKKGKHGTLAEILQKYEIYIRGRIARGEVDIETLRGKRCGCWCVNRPMGAPLPAQPQCHLDILNKILHGL